MTRRFLSVALLAVAPVLAHGTPAAAAEQELEIEWSTDSPLSGNVIDDVVVIDEPLGGVFPIVVIENPPLHGQDLMVTVDVGVREVGSPSFLELWVVLDDGGRFFSRTFDAAGVGLLRSGIIRTVELPFRLDGIVPAALELNVVLPDGGTVEIGVVRLYELDLATETLDADTDAWWSQDAGALMGAIGGGILGLLGALIGYLAGRGKARRFVTRVLQAGTVIGIILTVAGIVAVLVGQPFHVWFPMLLFGVLLAGVFGSLLRTIPSRYEALELQKMRAYDLV